MRICKDCRNTYATLDPVCPWCKSANTDVLTPENAAQNEQSESQGRVRFGAGVYIWCGICLLANIGVGLMVLNQASEYSRYAGVFTLLAVLSFIMAGLFLWLMIARKRAAYISMFVLAALCILIGLILGSGLQSFAPLVNLLITYLVLKKYWYDMD